MSRLLLATMLAALLAGPAQTATVDGVGVADAARLGDATLLLNGAGMRTRYFFNVYVAALYLPERTSDPARALGETGPIRLSMTMMRNLSVGELVGALREGIARNATPAELARTKTQLDELSATMTAIGGAKRGDLFTIDFLPDGTTRVGRNGRPQGQPIAGREFQRQLLAVWLGPNPVQDDLKRELLGS